MTNFKVTNKELVHHLSDVDEDVTSYQVQQVTVICDFPNSELHVSRVIQEYGSTRYGNNLIDICVETDLSDDTVIPNVVRPYANKVSITVKILKRIICFANDSIFSPINGHNMQQN